MYKFICIAISLLMVSCQGIRNTSTYSLELFYIEQGLVRQSLTVGLYIKIKCCAGKDFIRSNTCVSIRDTFVTIKNRTAYHMGMMRYLGRLTEIRPKIPKFKVEEYPICE